MMRWVFPSEGCQFGVFSRAGPLANANKSQGVTERAGTDVPQHTWHSSAIHLHISVSINMLTYRCCMYLDGKCAVAVEGV